MQRRTDWGIGIKNQINEKYVRIKTGRKKTRKARKGREGREGKEGKGREGREGRNQENHRTS